MAKPSIYQELVPRAFRIADQIPDLVSYLTTHAYQIMDEVSVTQLTSTRIGLHSLITELSSRIAAEGRMELYSMIRVRPKEDNPPALLTYRQIPLDLAQALPVVSTGYVGVIKNQDFLSDKLVMNTTPYTQASGQLDDGIGFHSAIVRDCLSRSFYRNDRTDWISPGFSQFISKVYTMILGTSVSQWYRLDMKNTRIISFLFALFYLTKIGSPESAIGILRTQWRYFLVPDSSEQPIIYGLIEETLPEFKERGLQSLEDVFAVIGALNIPRLSVDRNLLTNKLRGAIDADVVYTGLSLDYPPIFAYLVIRALSGIPGAMGLKLKNLGLSGPRERDGAITDILKSRSFIESLY